MKKYHPINMILTKPYMMKGVKELNYNPKTKYEIGLKKYLDWYLKYNF